MNLADLEATLLRHRRPAGAQKPIDTPTMPSA
jgi:hypothetical protein